MTQIHESFENGALVEAWLKEPTWLEPVDEGRVATIIHQTPQVRRWPPRVDLGRFAPMFNATKFAAASVILALTGGLLFNVVPTEPTPAEPIPAAETATEEAPPTADATAEVSADPGTPIIEIPDELHVGIEGGTIETPSGPIRWVRLDSTDGTVPREPLTALPWDGGIVVQDGLWGGPLYATVDGVTWERVPVEPPQGVLGYANGTYTVVAPPFGYGESGVWTWDGTAAEWIELDAAVLDGVHPDGWANRGRFITNAPASSDGRTMFTIEYRYRLPYPRFRIPTSSNKAMKRVSGDRYALCGTGTGNQSCAKTRAADAEWLLRFEETANGLAVEDARTGKRIGLMKGASADEIYEGTLGRLRQVFAIDGSRVVKVGPPSAGAPVAREVDRLVPDGAPEGARVRSIGSTWIAARPIAQRTEQWIRIGEEWVSLDEIGAPELGIASAAGNAIVLGDWDETWVLTYPVETE